MCVDILLCLVFADNVQYDDIKDKVGSKNFLIANKNSPPSLDQIDPVKEMPLVAPEEAATYFMRERIGYEIHLAIHELLGHGTGNRHLKEEEENGTYSFDTSDPPLDPIAGEPIRTWYKKNQDVASVFGDLGQSLNECRADCVALYLITNKELLAIFGYTDNGDITNDDSKVNSGV